MITDRDDGRIRLRPRPHWRLLVDDDSGAVWLSEASAADLGLFERACGMEFSSSREAIGRLRRSDHAAFVFADRNRNTVTAECRPRSRERLYVSRQGGAIEVAAGLRHVFSGIRTAPLSAQFAATWLANAAGFGGFDHFLGDSPFEGYCLIQQGLTATANLATGRIETALLTEEASERSSSNNLAEAIERCQTALRETILAAAARSSCVVAECSGGIDSSLVAVAAARALGERFGGGVFADYGHHEFRRERIFAHAVASRADFPLLHSDPRLGMCWGSRNGSDPALLFQEPSLLMPFWGQVAAAYDFVRPYASPTILTGLGGDQLFRPRQSPWLREKPSWVRKVQWDMAGDAFGRIATWLSSPQSEESGYSFVNPWLMHSLDLAHPGSLYYSPLSARCVIESVFDLRRHLEGGAFPGGTGARAPTQKWIARIAFEDYLPEMLWARRSKIDYTGLFYRFWLKFGAEFVGLVRRMSPQLEAAGFDSKAVLKRIREMSEGRQCWDPLASAVVTYSYWLDHFLFHTQLCNA